MEWVDPTPSVFKAVYNEEQYLIPAFEEVSHGGS
jgi:hypothetical protein